MFRSAGKIFFLAAPSPLPADQSRSLVRRLVRANRQTLNDKTAAGLESGWAAL